MSTKNNLIDIPRIYYINLERSKDRNIFMQKNFNDFGIKEFLRIDAIDGKTENLNNYLHDTDLGLNSYEICCTLSHLKAIEIFLESKEEYAIICEDDLDISISENWNFKWTDFFKLLPKNLEIIQLTLSTRKSMDINFHIHNRTFWDFGVTCYLIKRSYAQKITDYYKVGNKYDFKKYKKTLIYDKENLEFFSTEKFPTPEEIIYTINRENVYSMPIFSYKTDQNSLLHSHEDQSRNSMERVNNFWKNASKNFTLNDLLGINIL
jgi:glycosyl transferase family 25